MLKPPASEVMAPKRVHTPKLASALGPGLALGFNTLYFYCPQARLGIELDGGHHAEDDQSGYDRERTLELKDLNITILRFWNSEVEENLEGVLQEIFVVASSLY